MMTAGSNDNRPQVEERPSNDTSVSTTESKQDEQQRMRLLYEEQLRRMQCRGGGCGDAVFLG